MIANKKAKGVRNILSDKVLLGNIKDYKGREIVSFCKGIGCFTEKLLHPHREKQEKLLARVKELKELSAIASEAGMHSMYQSLNRESNEVFMEYLMCCFLDGISFLLPHALAIWLLSLKFSNVVLPVSLPWLGNQVSIMIWYPLCAVIYYAGRKYFKRKSSVVTS